MVVQGHPGNGNLIMGDEKFTGEACLKANTNTSKNNKKAIIMNATLNFKNIAMVAVFCLVAFLGYSAFKSANADVKANKVSTLQWFRYIGTDVAGETDENNYVLSSTEPQNCEGEGMRCAIYAEPKSGNPSKPDLTTIEEDNSKFQDLPE